MIGASLLVNVTQVRMIRNLLKLLNYSLDVWVLEPKEIHGSNNLRIDILVKIGFDYEKQKKKNKKQIKTFVFLIYHAFLR